MIYNLYFVHSVFIKSSTKQRTIVKVEVSKNCEQPRLQNKIITRSKYISLKNLLILYLQETLQIM